VALPKSVKLAVLLALCTEFDSAIGEEIPKAVVDLGRDEGLIGVIGGGLGAEDGGIYITDKGRGRMQAIMKAIS
jgi:hypothetical protein